MNYRWRISVTRWVAKYSHLDGVPYSCRPYWFRWLGAMLFFFGLRVSRKGAYIRTPLFMFEWMNGSPCFDQEAIAWGYRFMFLPKKWVVPEGSMIEFRWSIVRERRESLLDRECA